MNEQERKKKGENLRNESTKQNFLEKLSEKQQDTNDLIQSEVEMMWKHLMNASTYDANEF